MRSGGLLGKASVIACGKEEIVMMTSAFTAMGSVELCPSVPENLSGLIFVPWVPIKRWHTVSVPLALNVSIFDLLLLPLLGSPLEC